MGDILTMATAPQQRRKRFADFADEPPALDGKRTPIESILGEEIQVLAFRISKSKFDDSKTGTYTMIQFVTKGGERHVLFTASSILARQCEQYKAHMPFYTTIRQVCRYYTMT